MDEPRCKHSNEAHGDGLLSCVSSKACVGFMKGSMQLATFLLVFDYDAVARLAGRAVGWRVGLLRIH